MTIYEKCETCDGNGYLQCEKCVCETCIGSGKVKCLECENGKVKCLKCTHGRIKCGYCSGTGEIVNKVVFFNKVEACPDCYGAKAVACYTCKGSSLINCSLCHGYETIKCSSCSGTGKKIECSYCNGTGKIMCGDCDSKGRIEKIKAKPNSEPQPSIAYGDYELSEMLSKEVGTKVCLKCAASLAVDAQFCSSCSAPISPSVSINCPNCQKVISAESRFCKYCAYDQTLKKHERIPKDTNNQNLIFSRIAFERYGDNISELPKGIYTIKPDGSDCQRILAYGVRPRWSPDGQWIAFQEKTEDNESLSSIFIMRANGQDVRRLTFHRDVDTTPAWWSPDSKQIVYSLWYWQEKLHQICVMDLETGKFSQITNDKSDNAYPVWTPNDEIVFSKYVDSQQSNRLYIMNPDGQNQRECDLFEVGDRDPVWTYDGKKIVFRRDDFYVMNGDGSGLEMIPTNGRIPQMVISPYGLSVAYSCCDDTGESGFEVFVMGLDGAGKRKIVSNPCRNGKEVDSQDISWSPYLKSHQPDNRKRSSFSDETDAPIYIRKNNQQFGPFDKETLIDWLQNGQLSFDDLACQQGTNQWTPLFRLWEPLRNADFDTELDLLKRYFQEVEECTEMFMDDNAHVRSQMQSEMQRRLERLEKQIRSFKIQFIDAEQQWRYYESELYVHRAFLMLYSVGFLRKTAENSGFLLGITSGLIARQQEKNNAMQALALLDKSLEIYDSPAPRMIKVNIYLAYNQKAQALRELDYVIANFPGHKEAYLTARQKRNEIYN